MGVTSEAWVVLLTTGVGLFEGLTAGVEAACGGGKAMGWVDTIGISLILGGRTSVSTSLELSSSLVQPHLLVIFAPSQYTAYTIPLPLSTPNIAVWYSLSHSGMCINVKGKLSLDIS